MSGPDLASVSLLARWSTCAGLELHTALLWVMMKNTLVFCADYLTASRSTSPLAVMSAGVLPETCGCLATRGSALLPPVFKIGPSYSPQPKIRCNQSVASLIMADFTESLSFCKYHTLSQFSYYSEWIEITSIRSVERVWPHKANLGYGSSTLFDTTLDIICEVSALSGHATKHLKRRSRQTARETIMSYAIQHEHEFRRLSWLWAYCYDNKVC